MIHLIYIYLIVNSYLVGRYIGAYARSDNRFEVVGYRFCLFLFGGILSLLSISKPLLEVIYYIYREINFQYRFQFTDYWDKILLDDNYSEEFRTKEEKLKRVELMLRNGSKQLKRHNKQIQEKYGSKKEISKNP